MELLIRWLLNAPLWQAVLALLLQNVVVLVVALVTGHLLILFSRHRPVALPPLPLRRMEVLIAISSVAMNTVVTIVGLFLWRAGIIRFRTDVGVAAWLDVLILLLVMDFAMYILHRTAHHPWLFPLLHRMHHEYDRPRPLTLFLLNPAENLSFGALWLIVIAAYPFSWLGMSVYLVLNVLFGTIGHLGVEPWPNQWAQAPVVRHIAGSTFHARHHQDRACNFGFYTLIWDRLFGTMRPDYWDCYGTVPTWVQTPEAPSSTAADSGLSSQTVPHQPPA